MELELATMDPNLALLPSAYREAIKTELASRYFAGNDQSAPPLDIDPRIDRLLMLRGRGENEGSSHEHTTKSSP